MKNRTVLFVDDEEEVLKALRRGLIDEPYRILLAKSGADALDIMKRKEVNVIVTDMRMPEMSGLDLLKIVKDKYPHIIRLVLSGYAEINTVLEAINRGEIFRFITKPWKLERELCVVIHQAIEQYNLKAELREYNLYLEEKVKQRTEQLLAMAKQAEVGKYISKVVHDLKAPLQSFNKSILMFKASMYEEDMVRSDLDHYSNKAFSAAEKIRGLIADILQNARQEVAEETELVDINEIIKEKMEYCKPDSNLMNRMRSSTNLAENLPKISGKRSHFTQVIEDLLSNALDSMEKSDEAHLFVETGCDQGKVVIRIVDTGNGIAPENLEKIFTPGFTTKPMEKGTGLGLASVKEMVESYGGRIEVHSIGDKGSRFSVLLPADK